MFYRAGGAYASREQIDFVVDRILPEIRFLRLGGLGNTEQLIAPGFDYFLSRVRGTRLPEFQLTTNLSVMNPSRARILAASLTELEASLEGVETNYTASRGLPWERFRANFEMLRRAKAETPQSRMTLTLLICAIPRHFPDLLRFDLFREMGVERIILREMDPSSPELALDCLGTVPSREVAQFIERFQVLAKAASIEYSIPFQPRFVPQTDPLAKLWGHVRDRIFPDGRLRDCHLPFETLSITADGSYGTCCIIRELGDLKETLRTGKVDTAWNSPAFRGLRKEVNAREPLPSCARCEMKTRNLRGRKRDELEVPRVSAPQE